MIGFASISPYARFGGLLVNAHFPRALLLGFSLLGLPAHGTPLAATPSLANAALQEGANPEPKQAPDPNQLVAKVGRVEITWADLTGEYQRLIPWNFFHGKVPEERKLELRIQARDSLLEKALIFQDAQDRAIEVTEQAIRKRFDETLKKAGKQFEGLSDERYGELLEEVRPNLLRRILIDLNEERFDKSLQPVTEEALLARFEEVKEQLLTPESASFLMIQLDVDPAKRGAMMPLARLRADEIRKRFVGGTPFEELAKEYSDAASAAKGGALGFVTERGFPVPELGPPAFLMKDGETSEPLTSIYGVHLLHRIESRPRRQLEFSEARPQLMTELEHVQRSAERKAWLDALRERYPTQILIDIEK